MGRLRILKVATATAGAVLVAGAVVAITAAATGMPAGLVAAASPSPKPSGSPAAGAAKQQYCQAFVDNLANDLGKKPADVQAAAQKALGQTLDQAVRDGRLTQAQADQVKQKAASGSLCSALPMVGGHGAGAALGKMYLAEAAKVLGMTPADLQSALKGGQTLEQVAASKGKNEQQFRDALIAQVKSDLDTQVQSGKLTQAQEDAIINRLKTAPLPDWNGAPRGRHAGPPPTPGTTT